MPSPFPGMDLSLERPGLWPDVPYSLIIARRVNYRRPPEPRLTESDAAWAEALLREKL